MTEAIEQILNNGQVMGALNGIVPDGGPEILSPTPRSMRNGNNRPLISSRYSLTTPKTLRGAFVQGLETVNVVPNYRPTIPFRQVECGAFEALQRTLSRLVLNGLGDLEAAQQICLIQSASEFAKAAELDRIHAAASLRPNPLHNRSQRATDESRTRFSTYARHHENSCHQSTSIRVRSGGQRPCLIRPSTVSLLTIMIFPNLICLLPTSTTALPRPGTSTPSTIGVPASTSLATATMA